MHKNAAIYFCAINQIQEYDFPAFAITQNSGDHVVAGSKPPINLGRSAPKSGKSSALNCCEKCS
jgi:hypothetical protein